ncbi:MAG: hypothetical protein EPO22_07505 [Dehalococcoidia bacterium]|nr:MAG: hypothetical protein EPO22_07505 [Dehalococcoidia bacterium]
MDVKTAAYEVGEEVVVRLAHARLFDPRRGAVMSTRRRPPWMIARIIHCEEQQDGLRYVLSFQHRDAAYLCSVNEQEIEGTA